MSQADFKRRLKVLMLRPENQVCSDCPERQPRWASLIKPPPGSPPGTLSMGAFVCLECSGSHRRLGVHISFVRSVNLDQCEFTCALQQFIKPGIEVLFSVSPHKVD
jgi:stromal membrane-associated protein